jgi:hypothetical protein
MKYSEPCTFFMAIAVAHRGAPESQLIEEVRGLVAGKGRA